MSVSEVADLDGTAGGAERIVATGKRLGEEDPRCPRRTVSSSSATRRSWVIASTGQTGSQAPQSMHSLGLM